ncbi:DUF3139 domain-containing protein [Halobacillus salinarum]|uniref:DUF3139 domain-containing protein n=1 Tax=Halobacillus salinarum TaxID=2932257 RepID=A0ABY4EJG5_9BACI|nr:DUF3139 domain-containing protein [Halobacillus salinarum]UOQ43769.1 DUF3139 domain-containing protein [Halobacillus salinarum]
MMNYKKAVIMVGAILLIVGAPLIIYDGLHGNFIRDYLMEKQVKNYLISKGYEVKDISSIEADYNMKLNTKKVKGTFAIVVFKDEPEEKYRYIKMRKSGDIHQECSYYDENTGAYENDFTKKRKHMLKNCY